MAKHSTDPLICRMVSSSSRVVHCLSASSHHRSALATASAKPGSSVLATSWAYRVTARSPSRRVTFRNHLVGLPASKSQ
jgi:hypothetical protein